MLKKSIPQGPLSKDIPLFLIVCTKAVRLMYAKCNELATPKETRTLSFTTQKAKVEEQSGTTATIRFSNEWV